MKNRNINILRVLAFGLLITSFFITIDYLSRSLLLSSVVIGVLLFHKKQLRSIKDKSLLENLLGFTIVVLMATGLSFILLSDSDMKTKLSVGCLLLLFCIWRYVKHRTRHL